MSLIEPKDAQLISEVDAPRDFYWVLKTPAPLAGMRYPRNGFPWNSLAEAGFSCVVSLHPGDYNPSPLVLLFSEHLEDMIHGGPPRDPPLQGTLIRKAVAAILCTIRDGKGVVVHCCGGRGRTGTVLGCTLRALGYDSETVINYLDRLHKARGKSGWPESSWQADFVDAYPDA